MTTFIAARRAARDGFEQNKALEGKDLTQGIQHAEDVAKILKENVVQGRPDASTGRYSTIIDTLTLYMYRSTDEWRRTSHS